MHIRENLEKREKLSIISIQINGWHGRFSAFGLKFRVETGNTTYVPSAGKTVLTEEHTPDRQQFYYALPHHSKSNQCGTMFFKYTFALFFEK